MGNPRINTGKPNSGIWRTAKQIPGNWAEEFEKAVLFHESQDMSVVVLPPSKNTALSQERPNVERDVLLIFVFRSFQHSFWCLHNFAILWVGRAFSILPF